MPIAHYKSICRAGCLIPPRRNLRQYRIIPALRLKHRSGSCGTASALPKCSIMSGCGTRIVFRGQKPLALCDRCPCFGLLFPPLAALTFAASSIICAFGLASAAPRSPYRHLELCGIALEIQPASAQTKTVLSMWERCRVDLHRFFVECTKGNIYVRKKCSRMQVVPLWRRVMPKSPEKRRSCATLKT